MFNNTSRKYPVLIQGMLTLIIFSSLICNSFASRKTLKNLSVVQKFYNINNQSLYWLDSLKNSQRAIEWLDAMETASPYGIIPNVTQIAQIRIILTGTKKLSNAVQEKTDRQITEMVLGFIKTMHEGNVQFDYDEVNINKDSVYISQLMDSKKEGKVSNIIADMDCKDPEYLVLKKYLSDSVSRQNNFKFKTVILAMNYRRYMSVNQEPECILVNIPTAEAIYYKNDSATITMRTVPGKKTRPTPTISSHITSIVTFPAWNVPFDIAVKEMLPKIKKNSNYLEQNNFDVVDAKGNVIDDDGLNWKSYSAKNFPYFFRQSTGTGNSLGVIKFNLQDPFSIFLHATSWQGAFLKEYRFLSHGCVRLEKSFELADALLRGKLDTTLLKIGKKDSESSTLMLPEKVQTFIIYLPLVVANNKVTFLKDVYGLIK